MKPEYQKIFKRRLRQVRKKCGLSQLALANKVGYDRSYITKIESESFPINYQVALDIVSKFDLGLIIDQAKIKEFEDTFLKFYIATMEYDNEKVDLYLQYIQDHKDEIINSLCVYKYPLSTLMYNLFKLIPYKQELIDELLKIDEEGLFSDEDRQILYNLVGYNFSKKRDIDTAHSWYMKSLTINVRSLGYAMSAYRGTVNIFRSESYISAALLLGKARDIFQEYGIDAKVFDCDMLLGYTASKIGDHKEAAAIYDDLITRCKANNYRHDIIGLMTAVLHNIIDLENDDEVQTMISSIENEYLEKLDLDLCCVILYYFCLKHDKVNFQKWYELSNTLKDDHLNRTMITFFKAVIDDEVPSVVVRSAYEAIDACNVHFDKVELSMLKTVLLDYWNNSKAHKESADMILEVLYKLHIDQRHQDKKDPIFSN